MRLRTFAIVVLALAACGCAWGEATKAEDAGTGPALFVARDADSTIYLFGTIHLRRAGDAWGSPAVEVALASADEIWTEMEISPETDARTQQLALQYGLAPPDRPLSSWLSPEEMERLGQTSQRLGIAPQSLEPMQPWLAGLTLTLMPMMAAGYDPNAGVDRAVDAFGDAHHMRMRWFETPEEQIGLFANLPADVQHGMLLEAIDEAEKSADSLDQMSSAWERGDTQTLERLLNEEMRDDYPEVYAALISRRNSAWVNALMRELDGSGTDFVAVGAAHIVGPDGLVAQLRAHGIRVERVGARRQ